MERIATKDYATQLASAAIKDNSLSGLRDTLASHATKAKGIRVELENIAERIFGTIPERVLCAGPGEPAPPPPLSELIDNLGNELARIEAVLKRF